MVLRPFLWWLVMVTSHGSCVRSALVIASTASGSVFGPCRKRQLYPSTRAASWPVAVSKAVFTTTSGSPGSVASLTATATASYITACDSTRVHGA